jgi:hypothetical protein
MTQLVNAHSRARLPKLASRHWYWLIAVLGVGYAPLAVGYMWRYFVAGAPQWQASLTSAFDGRAYATGYGSVDWARAVAYQDHRVVMLIHTTLGGLALALGIFQLSGRLRRRWPVAHRWTGRVYLVLVAISMVAALTFLITAGPADHFGAPAFDLQLWALALGTLGTAALGFVAIRRRNIVAHQAWMGMNIALMLTAPLLRVFWIGMKPVWPRADLLANLGAGAITLAIVAPIAFMITRPRRAAGTPAIHAARTYGLIATTGAVATAVVAVRYAGLPGPFPREMLSVYLIPWAGATAACAIGAYRAHQDARFTAEKHWRILLTGLALVPVAINTMWLAATIAVNNMDAYLAAAMVASAAPIAIALAIVVTDASKRPERKPAHQPPPTGRTLLHHAPARAAEAPARALA